MIRQQKAAMKPEGDPSGGPLVHNIEASSGRAVRKKPTAEADGGPVQRSLQDFWQTGRASGSGAHQVTAEAVRSPSPDGLSDINDEGQDLEPDVPDAGPYHIYTGHLTPVGNSRQMEFERILNIESLGFLTRRWLVSRKRNQTLSDFTNAWRKNMLVAITDNAAEAAADDHLNDWV